jgi:nicotinate-nucleotide--dimethylbenzimidazole phosphoribosyltransferase
VDDAGLKVKQEVVAAALQQNQDLIQQGPLQALQAVGGLELAAMAGAYIEAGRRGIPAVIDGFISGVAALAAVRIAPGTKQCLFASHSSAEQGAQLLLRELGLQPMLQLGLRLGEGTGAVLAVPLLRSAACVMRDMATLQQVMESSSPGPEKA